MSLLKSKSGLIYALLFAYLFLSCFFISGTLIPAPNSIDDSWAVVLEFASQHGFQFGKDIVFNYGPLGFLSTPASQGYFVPLRLGFALFWGCLTAISALLFVAGMRGLARYLFLLWLLLFPYLCQLVPYLDFYFPLVAAAGAYLVLSGKARNTWQLLVIGSVFSLLSMVKFTFSMTAFAVIAICTICTFLDKDRRSALTLAAGFIASFLLLWVLCGQHPVNLAYWIKRSGELAKGYSRAMALLPDLRIFPLALLILAINAGLAIHTFLRADRKWSSLGYIISIQAMVFLIWKHGLTRADHLHLSFFLCGVPLLSGVVAALPSRRTHRPGLFADGAYAGVLFLAFAMVMIGQTGETGPVAVMRGQISRLADNAGNFVTVLSGNGPALFRSVQLVRSAPALLLPATANLVQAAPVDVMNYNQILALANGMNYRPRPVIQGYAAYTPFLQQLNAEFVRHSPAGSYILFRNQTIDNRLPALDDSGAFNQLLRNYIPVAAEGDHLLMAKTGSERINFSTVHEQALRFGQPLDLGRWNKEPLFLAVEMTRSLAGRGSAFLFQEFPLTINMESGTGKKSYRYVPAMGEQPFLLSPAVESNEDAIDLFRGTYKEGVDKITFTAYPGFPRQYEEPFTVRLYRADGLLTSKHGALPGQINKE